MLMYIDDVPCTNIPVIWSLVWFQVPGNELLFIHFLTKIIFFLKSPIISVLFIESKAGFAATNNKASERRWLSCELVKIVSKPVILVRDQSKGQAIPN